jgi:hypothetical protein
MGLISVSNIPDGTTIDSRDVNDPINTIVNEFNGNIDSPNMSSNFATNMASDIAAAIIPTIMPLIYPVNSTYISTVATNPATTLGFGTWVAIATGQALVGVDPADAAIDAAKKTTGAKTINISHIHGTDSQGTHGHNINSGAITVGWLGERILNNSANTPPGHYHTMDSQGAHGHNIDSRLSATQSVVQPSIAVYVWERTA